MKSNSTFKAHHNLRLKLLSARLCFPRYIQLDSQFSSLSHNTFIFIRQYVQYEKDLITYIPIKHLPQLQSVLYQ